METIVTMDLKAMSNALFVQFMSDVDAQVQRVTPDALKVKKCYAAFTDARTGWCIPLPEEGQRYGEVGCERYLARRDVPLLFGTYQRCSV